MCKKFISTLFIIFISQSILFSQDTCEDLSQDECTESLFCNWSIVTTPNGIFEICVENDDNDWEEGDICSQFPADVCETMPFCELTAAGCVMDMDEEDWEDEWLCSDIDNPYECYAMDCEWIQSNNTPIGGSCIDPDEGDSDSEDDDDEDGPPECLLDCEGIEYINPEENPYETCDWIISNFGPNNFINPCAEDCDNETMMDINEYMEVCFQCLADNNCDSIFDDNDDQDGCFENGEWYGYGQELFLSDCEYLECTTDGWSGPFMLNNDNCSNNNSACSDLEYEDCQAVDFCEWITDTNNPVMGGMCIDASDEGFPECLLDCPNIDDILEGNPDSLCVWIININETSCYEDCEEDLLLGIPYLAEACDECLDNDNYNCDDVFDDDDNDGGDDGGDGAPECLMDCEGVYDVNPEQDPYGTCEWIIESLSPNNLCSSDCEGEELIGLLQLSSICEECLAGEFDCTDIFDQQEDCNPDLMCAEVETCIDGLLYPTSCGPENCDEPISECNDEGVLYGYVEYIWGDAIEMVGGAHVIIQSMSDDNTMIEVYETITNEMGQYEILLPTGLYMVTASAYEDSETHDIYIESGHEHELNFQLGEWGWPEPQAILSLGDGIGTQEGFTIPLYLQTDTPVSGLQFAVLPEYAGGGFWFTPSELESTNDCFSASFNDVYSQLWGIMFSLEGCVYEPGEHHVANLSFTVATGSTVPPGTDVHLVFNYTLVSDPGANEIPSSGEGSMVTFGQLGDVNGDGAINVIDIVNMVNFALQIDEPAGYQSWAADLNQDGDINVLDIVSVVNIILYGDDLQRSDSGDAEIYHNKKEVHIEGTDVAGFQIAFLDDIDVNQIQIPDGWVSKSHGHSLMAYTLDGNLLNGRSIIKLNQSTEMVELIVVDANGEAIMASINMLPNMISLKGNFPNPFNPETSISYTLSHDAQVILSVYDLSGRLVETLVDGQQYAGKFLVSWSAHSLPSGMYIARLIVDGESFTQKMMLMK